MLNIIKLIIVTSAWIFANQADHLLLTRVVTQPTKAESFSITNPTEMPIDLANYYVSDAQEYYKIAQHPDSTFSNPISGFTAKFPAMIINPGETLIIALHEEYKDFYGDNFNADLVMFGSTDNSLTGSIGQGSQGIIHQTKELIILFYWDNQDDLLVQDVDYFTWGNYHKQINKTDSLNYKDDTLPENQASFAYKAREYYAYSRFNLNEGNEITLNGNGITENDETSEDFNVTWTLIRLPGFTYGCTDSYAMNYDPLAGIEKELDDLYYEINTDLFEFDLNSSCRYSFEKIIANEFDIDLDVKVYGQVVDFFDIRTVSSSGTGPQNITIENENGYRVTITVWDWEVANSNLSTVLTKYNENIYYVWANGKLGYYEDGDEWQIEISSDNNIIIAQNFSPEGEYIEDPTINNISINPEPYVIIPTLGETLDYNFTFSEKSRVIIRIFDISGRFITSLIDKYYDEAGIVECDTPPASWNGKDRLGQIVSPGTYIMHMEAMNPTTGKTYTDAAPIVVGVKN